MRDMDSVVGEEATELRHSLEIFVVANGYPALQDELGTPALAFVRAVCDALRLDSAVEEEAMELRHNLLRLTHTREFAPAAVFRVRRAADSALPFKPLHNVYPGS